MQTEACQQCSRIEAGQIGFGRNVNIQGKCLALFLQPFFGQQQFSGLAGPCAADQKLLTTWFQIGPSREGPEQGAVQILHYQTSVNRRPGGCSRIQLPNVPKNSLAPQSFPESMRKLNPTAPACT